jgi:hypothetical protein
MRSGGPDGAVAAHDDEHVDVLAGRRQCRERSRRGPRPAVRTAPGAVRGRSPWTTTRANAAPRPKWGPAPKVMSRGASSRSKRCGSKRPGSAYPVGSWLAVSVTSHTSAPGSMREPPTSNLARATRGIASSVGTYRNASSTAAGCGPGRRGSNARTSPRRSEPRGSSRPDGGARRAVLEGPSRDSESTSTPDPGTDLAFVPSVIASLSWRGPP